VYQRGHKHPPRGQQAAGSFVSIVRADAYHTHLLRTGQGDYQATPANRGVFVFRRFEGDVAHLVLTTLWDSVEAIKQFAGEDTERARYYSEDDDYLREEEYILKPGTNPRCSMKPAHWQVLDAAEIEQIDAASPDRQRQPGHSAQDLAIAARGAVGLL
jgi:hypothetical protein